MLRIGEVVRFGRVECCVVEMRTRGQTEFAEGNINSFLKNNTKFEDIAKAREGSVCKICMEEADTDDNFLLAPCRCIGSCQYVHLGCLRRWIESKVKKEVIGGTVCYNFDKFECEICKSELPRYIMRNGIHELLRIERPDSSYMILEELGNKRKDMIIINNVPAEGIKLGRGHQCSIRMADISVSRVHAFIQVVDDKFVLFDNNSKFGTLVKLQEKMRIDSQKKAFQVGRTVITFKIKKGKQETAATAEGAMEVESDGTKTE